MASPTIDDDDDFGGDYTAGHGSARRGGDKRPFGDLGEEEDDVFGSKKGKNNREETGPGAATGMILSLRESLQNCNDSLEMCQTELETTRTEIQKWRSAFQNIPAIPTGSTPEPGLVLSYLQNLKSSEESLKDQLEKVKKTESARIVFFAKNEQEKSDLKAAVRDLKAQLRPLSTQTRRLLLDPAIHEEFIRLKNLVEEKEKTIKELQDNLSAVNFTSNSKVGKLLMAKCRTLQLENEEIGAMASEGKIHELGMKIAVLKSQNSEQKKQFDALYKQMEGLTNDVDRSNEMVYILQEKLETKEYELASLREAIRKEREAAEAKPEPVLEQDPEPESKPEPLEQPELQEPELQEPEREHIPDEEEAEQQNLQSSNEVSIDEPNAEEAAP